MNRVIKMVHFGRLWIKMVHSGVEKKHRLKIECWAMLNQKMGWKWMVGGKGRELQHYEIGIVVFLF